MKTTILFCLLNSYLVFSQDSPELSTWLINTTNQLGYNNILANVDSVQYSTGNVYVRASGIPSYTIGPWHANPNVAKSQKYLFRIPRLPKVKTGNKTATRLGHIAVWKSGVPIYNPKDAFSYNNLNTWFQDAVLVEAISFDNCYGHPAGGGRYHTHQNPKCLYTADSTKHTGILGYSFDGHPIYGPYAYKNSDGTGGITRMRSSYKLRNITERTTLPDGTILTTNLYGPTINTTYPLGYYLEDYEFVQSYGDLDKFNGRTAKTPEYPNGTYAYYVTISAEGKSQYPYVMGPNYYGEVADDNFGAGQVTINESVVTYKKTSNTKPEVSKIAVVFELHQNYPNPFNSLTVINFNLYEESKVKISILDLLGREISTIFENEMLPGNKKIKFNATGLKSGIYIAQIKIGKFIQLQKVSLIK